MCVILSAHVCIVLLCPVWVEFRLCVVIRKRWCGYKRLSSH